MVKPIFDVHYANARTSLVMEADLDRGWGKRQKTCGFFRQIRIPYRNDLSIRAQLTLIAQPASFELWVKSFPEIDIEYGDDDLSYRLHNKHLIVKLSLLPHQPWRTTKQGRPELFFQQLPFLQIDNQRWYDLRAWVVFHESSRRPIQDVRVWTENTLIVPGGQFESNRRHH